MSQEYAAPASVLPVGTTLQIGKYRIVRFIASGGFGNTYEVVNVEFEERMAMKEFFMRGVNEREDDSVSVSVSNAENKQQFDTQKEKLKKEARRLRRLHNENIVKVHDLFEENGTVYYVMDYIDGESLSKRIKRTGEPLQESEVRGILPQLLKALEEVHRSGIWHLDIKPANIMVDSHGKALLIDFGASKQLRSSEGYSVSTSTAMCYTPGYAPMEQIEQDFEKFGPWTDFYALGATLYCLLTTKKPPSTSEINEGDAFAYPSSVSPRMRQLVEWLMQPARRKRPQSVDEIRDFIKEQPINVEEEETTVYVNSPKEEETVVESEQTAPNKAFQKKKEDVNTQNINKNASFIKRMWMFVLLIVAIVSVSGFFINKSINSNDDATDLETLSDEDNSNNDAIGLETLSNEDRVIIDNLVNNMVYVEGGTFVMGATSEQGSEADNDEKPTHSVTLSSYYIGKYEVTQAEWRAVMGSNPSYFKGDNLPVENVSWNDCQEFIRKLNSLTGKNFRLPTEAEWEFAARGGNNSRGYKYSGSNDIGSVAWYDGNSGSKTHPVGQKSPNELGLYDMSGNVWAWCQDWYGSYSSSSQTNPTGPNSGSYRVNRGGGWDYLAGRCRVSNRDICTPGLSAAFLGLRLVL